MTARCWCGYEPPGTTETDRLRRWQKARDNRDPDASDWVSRDQEEQDAWDAMAEHDDPEYVRRVEMQ